MANVIIGVLDSKIRECYLSTSEELRAVNNEIKADLFYDAMELL